MNLITLLTGTELYNGKIGSASDIKLLRHTRSKDVEVERRLKADISFLEAYQAHQSENILGECKIVLAFVGDGPKRGLFRGAWQVEGKINKTNYLNKYEWAKETIALDGPNPKYRNESFYNLARINLFSDLVDRLVISWSQTPVMFSPWLTAEEVIEVYPKNYIGEFSDFYGLVLSHDELRKLIANPDSNRIWFQHLSSVAGVYLILDRETGKQYVGSAYGAHGIWGRWATYARSPSGGNVLLEKLLSEKGARHADNFQFSILRVLEKASTKDQVIRAEQIEKMKLGTRAFGLTLN
jgi:hypothetical protein